MSTSDPGLNVAALQALRRPRPGAVELTTRIREHLDTHDGYVASDNVYGGGSDRLLSLSVDVAAAVDVHDLYSASFPDDCVDDPIVAAAGRVQADQIVTEGFANPMRVLHERSKDELDAGCRDLLRKPL